MRRPLASLGALLASVAIALYGPAPSVSAATSDGALADLGRTLFFDKSLSRDGSVSCSSCHNPSRAYADSKAVSTGFTGRAGTRNAPSLVGVEDDAKFFWDGRRSHLEDAVIDPFTNPVEFGWPSIAPLLDRLETQPELVSKFRHAFPQAEAAPTLEQIRLALAGFVRSLSVQESTYERVTSDADLTSEAEEGRRLFEGIAGCSQCHAAGKTARFSDGQFHHSGIGQQQIATRLPAITQAVVQDELPIDALGPKVLTDPDWSNLGRFVVTHKPADIGTFLTPSLRNVAVTGPYMHDGSIATLTEAVDHEIYYRGLSQGRPINLSAAERKALILFLESLTDFAYVAAADSEHN